jgi:hypothetical protein
MFQNFELCLFHPRVPRHFPTVDQNPKPELSRADVLANDYVQIAIIDVRNDATKPHAFVPLPNFA